MLGLSADFIWLLLGLGLAAMSVYLFSSAILSNNQDAEAFCGLRATNRKSLKVVSLIFPRPLVHNFTLQHAARVKSPEYRKNVERKILRAGLGDELNVDEFIGLQILWGVMAPAFLTLLNFALQLGYPYWFCVLMGIGGSMFPHLYCRINTQDRYLSVVADLPFFIDLMALSTEAGLDFINAIQRIVDKAQNSVLAEELKIVLKDIKLGRSRSDALRDFAYRLDIPEITSFVAVVNDADQTGASIAQVLKDQSAQMRLERFVRAEKMGAKASQTMLIPMIVFILPAVFIVVFAPVILQFIGGGK
jgi:tight adherence protein C